MESGRLFVISGPSGTGKGTICKRIIDETDASLSISMTTRNPRPGEVDGVNYYFSSKENFLKTVEEGGLLEYAEVYGNYYGTPKAKVVEKLEAGNDVILEIDIQGALNVKKVYPDAILLFILPPSLAELRKRIIDRGTDSMDVIELRMSKTLGELEFACKYDYRVINDDLDEAVSRVKAIMTAEHSKVTENINLLIDKYKEEA